LCIEEAKDGRIAEARKEARGKKRVCCLLLRVLFLVCGWDAWVGRVFATYVRHVDAKMEVAEQRAVFWAALPDEGCCAVTQFTNIIENRFNK
jgi:hypothetical protein